MKRNRQQKGFTLIEVIVTLILIGILGSLAGMGIVQATKSYLFTRDATEMAQKSQVALARMSRTFLNISDIDFSGGAGAGAPLQVVVERNDAQVTETYQFSGSTLTVLIGANSHVLLDNLAATSGFQYLKNDGTAWGTGDDEEDLSRIVVNINMNSQGGQTVAFSGSFVPRNIYRPVDISDFTTGTSGIPDVSGCFISSVGSGQTHTKYILCLIAGAIALMLMIPAIRRKK